MSGTVVSSVSLTLANFRLSISDSAVGCPIKDLCKAIAASPTFPDFLQKLNHGSPILWGTVSALDSEINTMATLFPNSIHIGLPLELPNFSQLEKIGSHACSLLRDTFHAVSKGLIRNPIWLVTSFVSVSVNKTVYPGIDLWKAVSHPTMYIEVDEVDLIVSATAMKFVDGSVRTEARALNMKNLSQDNHLVSYDQLREHVIRYVTHSEDGKIFLTSALKSMKTSLFPYM